MMTVVTMTSWTKRIHCVKSAIEYFLKTQTVKPDYFYLWLAESEFPNKEKDLPATLLRFIIDNKILLQWTKCNEYCHKRWYVYPRHYDDLVISIDDDQHYPPTLIETVQKLAVENPKSVITIARTEYKELHFNETYVPEYKFVETEHTPYPMFCGQCAFPPATFPLDAVSTKYLGVRDAFTPKCDECWLLPWLVKNKRYNIISVPMLNEPFDDDVALWKELNAVDLKTWKNPKWISMFNVLSHIGALDEWKKLFPMYRTPRPYNKKPVVLALNCGINDSPLAVRQIIDSANSGLYKPDYIVVNRPYIDLGENVKTYLPTWSNENVMAKLQHEDAVFIIVSTNYCKFKADTIQNLLKTYLATDTHWVIGEEFRKYDCDGTEMYSPRIMLFDNSAKIEFDRSFGINPHLDICWLLSNKYKHFDVAESFVTDVTEEYENSSEEFKKEIENAYSNAKNGNSISSQY